LLSLQLCHFLFRQPLILALCLHLFDVAQPTHALPDRLEVGERPAQPAMVDKELLAASGLLFDHINRLLFCSDKYDRQPFGGHLPYKLNRLVEFLQSLLQIDNVYTVLLSKEILLHLRVPALGLMSEVNPRFQQFLDRYRCHTAPPFG
jgi:hypothetical protein